MKTKIVWKEKITEETKDKIRQIKSLISKMFRKHRRDGATIIYSSFSNRELLAEVYFGKAVENNSLRSCLKEIQSDLDEEVCLPEKVIEFRNADYPNTTVFVISVLDFDFSLFELWQPPGKCPECQALPCELHHFGCLAEICPICGSRLSRCSCPFLNALPPDDWIRTPEGYVPQNHTRIRVGC